MNPEFVGIINKWFALDRMPVSLSWGLDIDTHPTFAEQGIQVSREMERILGIKGFQKCDGYSYFYIRIVTKNLC